MGIKQSHTTPAGLEASARSKYSAAMISFGPGHTVRRVSLAHYIIITFFVTAMISVADTLHQSAPPVTTPSTTLTPDRLESEIAELRKKAEKPPKDGWDKLTALSGLSSGILVALIGFYATNVYSRRQKASEERRKDQEILISQIQTVEKFIPHLASDNEQIKGAALIALAALGNEDLAVRLASAFKGSGATRALTEIASTGGDTQAGQSAKRALVDVLAFLQPRIVTFYTKGLRRATGFIVSPNGLMVTTAHAVEGEDPSQFEVKLPSGQMSPVNLVKIDESRDLALLKTDTAEELTPLDLSPGAAKLGESVVALLIDLNGSFQVQLGTLAGLSVSNQGLFGKGLERIAVSLPVFPGSSGTPVVDREGRLLGLVQASNRGTSASIPMTYLIPAEEALAFVNQ
ncbi:MAG TPA: serine protease [Candidatus Polarisedimenticolia bacterium]|nr:serine protease [Candidatus Polarisedimenticolia bacterium]